MTTRPYDPYDHHVALALHGSPTATLSTTERQMVDAIVMDARAQLLADVAEWLLSCPDVDDTVRADFDDRFEPVTHPYAALADAHAAGVRAGLERGAEIAERVEATHRDGLVPGAHLAVREVAAEIRAELSAAPAPADTATGCVCTAGHPESYEGPLAWCDVHGQPSTAYRQGHDDGAAEARDEFRQRALAAVEAGDDEASAFVGWLAAGGSPVRYRLASEADTQPAEVHWRYGFTDPDAPGGVVPIDGTPRVPGCGHRRRAYVPLGEWEPIPGTASDETAPEPAAICPLPGQEPPAGESGHPGPVTGDPGASYGDGYRAGVDHGVDITLAYVGEPAGQRDSTKQLILTEDTITGLDDADDWDAPATATLAERARAHAERDARWRMSPATPAADTEEGQR